MGFIACTVLDLAKKLRETLPRVTIYDKNFIYMHLYGEARPKPRDLSLPNSL